MLLAVMLSTQAQAHRGFSAKHPTMLPRIGPEHLVQPHLCDAKASRTCSWSIMKGTCDPQDMCRPKTCGLITCECEPISSHELKPWQVIGLNYSSASSPRAIKLAFRKRVKVLAPDKNTACLHYATHEYIAARRARDTLLLLANAKQQEHCEYEPALAVTPATTTRRREGERGGPARQRRRDNRLSSPGSQITVVVAVKFLIYRLLRDCKTKLVNGWWSRARLFVSETVNLTRRAVSSVVRFVRNSAVIELGLLVGIATLSFIAVPLALTAA